MTYPGFRVGTFATYRGRERSCAYRFQTNEVIFFSRSPENPDPDLYEWDDVRKGWIAVLNAGDCDRVFAVNTFVLYRGHRCEVTEMRDDGTAEILYADWNGAWAVSGGGFEQRNKYEYYKIVTMSELYDYHEEQRDELFDQWRERSFPRPAQATP
jgi:hypothetical protein